MPVIPVLLIGGIIVARTAYQFGGDAVKEFFDKIANVFKSIIAFVLPSVKSGKEYAQKKEAEIEKKETQDKTTKDSEQPSKEEKEKEAQKDAPLSEKQEYQQEQTITDGNVVRKFVPEVWKNMSYEDKENAVSELVSNISKHMNLSLKYDIKFGNLEDNEEGIKQDISGDKTTITFDKNAFLDGTEKESINLYCAIVKQLAYARQHEVNIGITEPNNAEKSIKELVAFNQSNIPVDVHVGKTYFLNVQMHKLEGIGNSIISASSKDTYERRALAILQPCERIPSRMQALHFQFLKNELERFPMSDEIKSLVKEYDDMSYYKVIKEMRNLYQCHNIEQEIDKIMQKNNPLNIQDPTKDIKYNKQLDYAIGLYQLQTKAEMDGDTVLDERQKILNDIHGKIAVMSDKQFLWNKGRIMYEKIEVKEIRASGDLKKEVPTSYTPEKPKSEEPVQNPKDNKNQSEPEKPEPESEPESKPVQQDPIIIDPSKDLGEDIITGEEATRGVFNENIFDRKQEHENGESIETSHNDSEEETSEEETVENNQDVPPINPANPDYEEYENYGSDDGFNPDDYLDVSDLDQENALRNEENYVDPENESQIYDYEDPDFGEI